MSSDWTPLTEAWLPRAVRENALRRSVPVGHRERHSGWLVAHFDPTGQLLEVEHFVGKHTSNGYHLELYPLERRAWLGGTCSTSWADGQAVTSTPYDGDSDPGNALMPFAEFLQQASIPAVCVAKPVPALFLCEDEALGSTSHPRPPRAAAPDFSWLERGYVTSGADGFRATFHPDGRLATFARVKAYQPEGLQLDLELDGSGWLFEPGRPLRRLLEVHQDGRARRGETFEDVPFEAWVRRWIDRLYERERPPGRAGRPNAPKGSPRRL